MEEKRKFFTKKVKIIFAIILSAIIIAVATVVTVSEVRIRRTWWYASDSHDAVVTFTVPAFEYQFDGRTITGEKQTISIKFSDQGMIGVPTIDWCPKEIFDDIEVEIKVKNRTVCKGVPQNARQEGSRGYVRFAKERQIEEGKTLLYYRFYYEKDFENEQYFIEQPLCINNCTEKRNP